MLASGRRRKRLLYAAGNHAVCSADERCTRLVCGAGEPPARWAFGGTGRCSKRPASQRGGSDSSWNRSGAGRRVAVSSRWSGRRCGGVVDVADVAVMVLLMALSCYALPSMSERQRGRRSTTMLASGRRRKRLLYAAGNHAVCSADERCTRLVCGAGEPPARWAFGGTGRCSKRPASQRGGSDSSWNRSGAGRRVAVSSRWSGRCTAAAASGGPSSAAPDGGAWCRASRRSSGWSRRCAAAASSSGSGVAREVERGVGHRVVIGWRIAAVAHRDAARRRPSPLRHVLLMVVRAAC